MNENIQKVVLTADNRTKSAFAAFRKDVRSSEDSVSGLQKTSALLRTGLGALGVTVSTVAFTGMVRGVANAQDSLAKMSQQTGVAVETLAGLEFAAGQSGTSLDRTGKAVKSFSKIILEADGGTDKYSKLIKALGLDLEALKSATPEDQFISLAGAIKNNVSEQERGAVVTALLGQRYTELIPLLSQGEQGLRDMISQGQKLNQVTAESAAQAEIFNDNIDKLQRSFGTVAIKAVNTILPTLAEISSKMADVTDKSGALAGVLAGIDSIFTSIAKSGEFGQGILGPLGYLLAQKNEANDVAQAMEEIGEEASKATKSINGIIIPPVRPAIKKSFSSLLKDMDDGGKKSSKSIKTLTTALSDEEKQVQETAREIERLTIKFDPLIAYNKELNELIRLRKEGLPDSIYSAAVGESIGKYIAATQDASDSVAEIDERTQQLQVTTQQAFDTNQQIVISGVRGIQSALADGLFNFFDDGISGMIRSVKNAIGRIISEFASIKLLQSSGLIGALGLGSSPAIASGGGGIGALDIASIASGGVNLLTTGFGATSLAGGGLAAAGTALGSGSLAAFGGGLAGDAIGGLAAGITAGASTSSAAAAASAGSAAASIAGPLIVAAIADIGFRALAGDKTLGNFADNIPLVGSLGALFFGRGPLKQKETNLIGDFTADGFSGVTSTKFKAQGGLARGDKIDRIINDTDTGELLNQYRELVEGGISSVLDPAAEQASLFALELGSFLDESVQDISASLRGVADNLGLSQSAIDNFSTSINIASEKGEALSEAQIGEEIAKVADAMAVALIPNIKEFSLRGETAANTATRLNNEFSALSNTLQVIGIDAKESKEILQAAGFDQRTNLVNLAGGIDALNTKTANLFDKLKDSDKLDVLSNRLQIALSELGVNFIPTLDQFTAAMTSGRLSVEQFIGGLDLQDMIAQVDSLRKSAGSGNITDALNKRADTAQAALDQLSLSVEAERNKLTIQYNDDLKDQNDLIQNISGSISELTGLYDALKSSTQQIRTLGISAARGQIEQAIAAARQGNFSSASDLQQAFQTLTSQGTDQFSTRVEFLREQAKSASLLDELGSLTDDQISVEKRSLLVAEQARDNLSLGFEREIGRLDDILSDSKIQVDLMRGIDSGIKSLTEALLSFRTATGGGGFASSGSSAGAFGLTIPQGLPNFSSPSPVGDQAIIDFFKTNPTPQQLSQAAIATGVSSGRIAKLGGYSQSQVEEFFRNNPNIAKFHGGGSVSRDGLAVLQKDEQVYTSEQNTKLVNTMELVLTEIRNIASSAAQTASILDQVTAGGGPMLVENA